jgi:hypothetical protein
MPRGLQGSTDKIVHGERSYLVSTYDVLVIARPEKICLGCDFRPRSRQTPNQLALRLVDRGVLLMGVENNGTIFGLEKDLETFVGDKRNKAVFKIISLLSAIGSLFQI